ncbi:glycoside hydrolase superfamily [Paraphoma chrysanthemicola]|uniref:chitinase n=1 Tax=Paraphoma chrysanthemicola TaxID=798071 RepID=A0A8K0W1B5_9PLEO|nr:glycoside hydrolase superfamily [Paraphoma chrysanthemicola]
MHISFSFSALLAPSLLVALASARFVIYADEWHPTRPTNEEDRAGIDHVVLAFAMANATAAFQPKVPISTIRSEFPNAKVMIAVGGWGDDIGFFEASKSDATIDRFAAGVATMLTNTGADGVDIDWEYPGGNGADYKQVPNEQKTYQIEAFPKFLAATRKAIGDKLLSIAVPGKKGDMIGYTEETGPKIWPSVDYINVMSYDLMNRRDNVTKHHSSVAGSAETIENYLAIGAPPEKINLGFAYYAKYFTTAGDCTARPLDCPIVLAEDPITGKDLLTSGAWTFETFHMQPVSTSALTVSWDGTCGPEKGTKCSTGCCSQYGNCGTSPEHCSGACQHAFGTGCTDADVAGSWQNALKNGVTDEEAGGQYYLDAENGLFWTWDTPDLIERKFEEIVTKYGLGGVMAWSLGEDSADWSHIKAMNAGLKRLSADGYGGKHSNPLRPASPYPSPDYEAGPADGESPSTEDLPLNPEESSDPRPPYKVVWVDGTTDGPSGDYSTEPGAPEYYVNYEGEGPGSSQTSEEEYESTSPAREGYDAQYNPQQETASTPQQDRPVEPLPKEAPAQETAPVQQQEAALVKPQEPAVIEQDTTSLDVEDTLPFSPEYEALLRELGGEVSAPAPEPAPAPAVPETQIPAEPVVADRKALAGGRACRLKRKKRVVEGV